MRKMYMRPVIEVEAYTLDQTIAGNCGNVVTLGPGDYAGSVCDAFKDDFEIVATFSAARSGTSFYDGSVGPACDCYYSSGGQGYFTS